MFGIRKVGKLLFTKDGAKLTSFVFLMGALYTALDTYNKQLVQDGAQPLNDAEMMFSSFGGALCVTFLFPFLIKGIRRLIIGAQKRSDAWVAQVHPITHQPIWDTITRQEVTFRKRRGSWVATPPTGHVCLDNEEGDRRVQEMHTLLNERQENADPNVREDIKDLRERVLDLELANLDVPEVFEGDVTEDLDYAEGGVESEFHRDDQGRLVETATGYIADEPLPWEDPALADTQLMDAFVPELVPVATGVTTASNTSPFSATVQTPDGTYELGIDPAADAFKLSRGPKFVTDFENAKMAQRQNMLDNQTNNVTGSLAARINLTGLDFADPQHGDRQGVYHGDRQGFA